MMNGGGEGLFVLLAFIPFILYLALLGFVIYFIIKIVKFMNAKTKSDQEINEKMNELIRVISQNNKNE